MDLIFTSGTGRSGQHSLTKIFNDYGIGCFAEVDPPDLYYRASGILGVIANRIQRKWIVTHEMLGRGKALEWYENNDDEKLNNIALKKINRIKRLQKRHKFETYIEISKFFMRTQCDHIFQNTPNFSLLKLTRDPLLNARSYTNRKKNFYLDNVPPHYNKNCLKMDGSRLTIFQLYLWSWVEIELRYYRFLDKYNVKKVFELRTDELNNNEKIIEMFKYFDISYREIKEKVKVNTNVQQGLKETVVQKDDVKEYEEFVKMIPSEIFNRVKYLTDYDPYKNLRSEV